ncbi:MAG: sensor histidine kinase, partial [Eubacterium sp.]|nr:sensor histidine kinase [Eubacterium sp.]
HRVEIADDGIGFDVEKARDKDGVHIGLVNTEKRLELMCGGTMEVESEPGVGTRIVLSIPEAE